MGLPAVGGSNNVWGTLLNAFLGVSLNADGTINWNSQSVDQGPIVIPTTGPPTALMGYSGDVAIDPINQVIYLKSGSTWTPYTLGTPPGTINQSVNPVPSATANTYGAAVSITLPVNSSGIQIIGFDVLGIVVTCTGIGAETVTIQVKGTFNDTSTGLSTAAYTTATSAAMSMVSMQGLFKPGLYMTSLIVQAESSIASSTCTPAVRIVGKQVL